MPPELEKMAYIVLTYLAKSEDRITRDHAKGLLLRLMFHFDRHPTHDPQEETNDN